MKKSDKPSDFRKILEQVSRSHDTRRVFDGFVRLAACTLAAQTREPEYLEEAKRWTREELSLFGDALGALILEMERHPFEDLIGCYYMEFALSTKGQQWNGEFHTPHSICELMAKMTLDGVLESKAPEETITICEPACGAGAMILALGKACPPERRRKLRVVAIDINRTACDMTFINTTLWGIPTCVIHGNTISMQMWAEWKNIHYVMPWLGLLALHPVSCINPPMPKIEGQGEPPKPAVVEQIKISLGKVDQKEFAFA